VAQRLGLSRCPEVLLLPAPIPPLLWSLTSAPRLLLPAALLERLGESQLETLLAHELAHLRRRDHWVRRLELVVLGLYWWHPVAWWARHKLQEAEEQCCDAWVVWALPDAAHVYAEALVQTITFLSRPPLALPALASGIGHVPLLKRRLTMILNANTPRRLTCRGLLAVLAFALVLPLLPMRAAPLQAGPDEPDAVKEPPQRSSDDKIVPVPDPRPIGSLTSDLSQPITDAPNPLANAPVPPQGQKKDRPKPSSGDSNGFPNDTPRLADDKVRPTESRTDLMERVQEAEEQIELLQAKLAIKEAQLRAARTALTSANEKLSVAQRVKGSGQLPESEYLKIRDAAVAAEADLIVKQAELKEPQILLRQAERRLAKLKERVKPAEPKKPTDAPVDKSAPNSAQLRDLDKKLDALRKEVESLRREIRKARPQPEARNGAGDGVLYVNHRDFKIPVAIDATAQKKLKEIVLFTSTDEGRTWQQAGRAAPTEKHFTYHASADGEYWFHVATVDKDGRTESPIKDLPASQMKIRVLTKPPTISLTVERRAADFAVHWDVSGQHVDLQSLRLEHRAAKNGDGPWSVVPIDPEAKGEVLFGPDEGIPIEVRMRAKDRAGNVGESTVEVPGK
jgi:hypothetical protein